MSESNIRPTSIGGQAVMEGVMMRGKRMYAMAVRRPDNGIEMVHEDITPLSDKYPFWGWPIFRGIASFGSSLVLGMKILTKSAEIAGDEVPDENEKPGKFEQFLIDKFGDKLMDYVMYFSVILSLGISMLLFLWLPVWISHFALGFIGDNTWILGVLEGFVKIFVFIAYILLISRSKEIQRVFAYHGAEHKTINCYEHNEELTVENVRKHTRLHKRCGTSFLLIVMLISMIVFIFVRVDTVWIRFGYKILFVPLIAGISYEVIRWAGRSESVLVSIVSFPGICMQKLTTAEPDDAQIETAIAAMQEVLRSEPS